MPKINKYYLSSHVLLIRRGVVVDLQVPLIFNLPKERWYFPVLSRFFSEILPFQAFVSHLLPFVFVRKFSFLLFGQVSPHLSNDSTNLPKFQFRVFILHLERNPDEMLLVAASNQPDPRPSCCIACRASRASQALWEVLEPRVLEVF